MRNFPRTILLNLCCTAALLFSFLDVKAQDSTMCRVEGKVLDADNKYAISYFMVVNKSTGSGTFGNPNGTFILNAQLHDTLIIGSQGYGTENYIVKSTKETLKKTFYLKKIAETLPEVRIIPERELREIKEDIDKLGYDESDYRLSGVDVVEHPITFLYQAFSKREQQYREVAALDNETRKRELLKELFEKYVDYEIISLKDEDFDAFVDYCNLTEQQMQNSTQYEFIQLIKARYKGWEIYSKRLNAIKKFRKKEE